MCVREDLVVQVAVEKSSSKPVFITMATWKSRSTASTATAVTSEHRECLSCHRYNLSLSPSCLHFLSRNSSHGRMVSCDFCPLVFHLDCLHPPLTIPPSTVWMCPIHPNTKIVSPYMSNAQIWVPLGKGWLEKEPQLCEA